MLTPVRPRLAHVVNSLDPGGAERLVVEMAKASSADFEVFVFCLDGPGAWAGRLREAGVPVYGLWRQPGLDLSVPVRLAAQFRRLGIDIVHAHQYSAWFYAALSRLMHAAPRLVFEEHGRFYPEANKPLRRLVNAILVRRLTHAVVAVSRDVQRRLVRYEGLDGEGIEVIHNGVAETPPVDAASRRQARLALGLGVDDFVVGTVGRFDPVKNLRMLVAAMAVVAPEVPNLKGLLIGAGPDWEDIRGRVADAGLSKRILMTGHRDEARVLVAAMDLFVLSSLSEGTSLALLEAMAAGVAVLVTDVGGNPEVVLDNVTGWVIPSGDEAALAAAIRCAARDPEACRRMGDAGRLRFEEEFTLEAMIGKYRKLYEGLPGAPFRAPARVRA